MSTTTPTTGSRPAGIRGFDTARLVLGAVSLVLGVAVLAVPDATLLVVALAFGVQLLVSGLVRTVLGARQAGWRRVFAVVLGALTVVAGIVCVLQPGTSLLVLLWTAALGWLSDGVSELVVGIAVEQPRAQRAALVLFGLTSIVGAVLITVFPGASLAVFTVTGGVLLVILGVLTLVAAARSRRRTGSTERAATS